MISNSETKNKADTFAFSISLIILYVFCYFPYIGNVSKISAPMIVSILTSCVFWKKRLKSTKLQLHNLIKFSALWGFISFVFMFVISQIRSLHSMSWLAEADYYKYSAKHFAHMLYPNLFYLTGIFWLSANIAKITGYMFTKYEFSFVKDEDVYKIIADNFGHTSLYINNILKYKIKNRFTLKQKSVSSLHDLECIRFSRTDFIYRQESSITLTIAKNDNHVFLFSSFDKYYFKSALIAGPAMFLVGYLLYFIFPSSNSIEISSIALSIMFESELFAGYISSKLYCNKRSISEVSCI